MHAARLQAADHPPPPPPRGLDAGIGRPVADRVACFRMWLYCLTALSDGVLSHATAVRGATMKELKVTPGLMLVYLVGQLPLDILQPCPPLSVAFLLGLVLTHSFEVVLVLVGLRLPV